jgi:hypothetical protein
MKRSLLVVLAAFLILLNASPLSAQEPAPASAPAPIELVIEPRAIQTPALRYRLLPTEAEIKAGNAAPILLRLPWEQTPWMNTVFAKLGTDEDKSETRPLTDPEWTKHDAVVPPFMYGEMKRAAFRRDASWEYPIGETQTPYLILLPDVQGLRGFLGRALSAKIRYHLSQGELDEAREGILVGLANSRHIARTPFYVNQLVAMAIQRTMLDRTTELMVQPESPNLYWALSNLPGSLIDLDRAANCEGSLLTMSLPAAADLNSDLDRKYTAAEWQTMGEQLAKLIEMVETVSPPQQPAGEQTLVEQLSRLIVAAPPRFAFVAAARAELPEVLGISAERVAAMSDDEAAIRWYVAQRLKFDQLGASLLGLPPREAIPLLTKLVADRAAMQKALNPTHSDALHPASMYVAVRSLHRKIAALRIIEAVRDYLASHDGKLPDSLDEITSVPIPLDPLTDQPFVWKIDGTTAELTAPPVPAALLPPHTFASNTHTVHYRLRVK